ncbi:hypothetical protein POTOM_040927 [Populus tomentosa]|uniref:Uncharacterized protein n=1 Tax=Populus tomentosa TaxID=118781 RepID=A0A8X7YLL9_POPTO|nr:hypothetical protein POTOM_040927 [Populus tomentosa]
MGTVNKDEILKEVGKEWDESGGEESFDISEISFDISRLLDSLDLGVLAIGLGRIDILRKLSTVRCNILFKEEGIKCNWSVYKTTPQARKSKVMVYPSDNSSAIARIIHKGGSDELASLEEANDDSESLTDFLVGFEQEE